MRAYVSARDDINVAFGVLQLCQDRLKLQEQHLKFTLSTKVSDALAEVTNRKLGAIGVSYSVHTAIHVPNAQSTSLAFSALHHDELFDLKLIIVVEFLSDNLTASLFYDVQHIEHFYAVSLSHAFATVFARIVANPSIQLDDISCLAPQHEEQLRRWNSDRLQSWPCKLHHMFEQTACNRAQDLAVQSHDGDLTFEQLDHLSNSVVSILLHAGVKAGDFVGHCYHLGKGAIIGTLAIFKANCVSVPLDPTHPPQRHVSMLRTTRAKFLLSDRYPKSEGSALGVTIVLVELDTIQDFPTRLTPLIAQFENLNDDAVVCFTSGSTGTPKGIVQTHEGLATMVRALVTRLRISSDSRVSGLHPYVFDVSIMEMFTAFLAGAVLCIPRKEDMMIPHPRDLGKALATYSVTHAVMSPTMLKTLDPAQVSSIRVLASMGESLDHDLLNRWGGHNQPELFQLWGTTEASILQSCTEPLQPEEHPHCVGKPLPGTCRFWIADWQDHRRLVPVGAMGEILVEGPALAKGYLYDEEKTRASFVSSPNWLKLQDAFNVYKTGDLGRYGSDGSIMFIGRRDNQVNFHGERVELEEIDYRLLQLCIPDVADVFSDFIWASQTIVTFFCFEETQSWPGSPRLVPEHLTKLQDVLKGTRERLCQYLPAYMVPRLYIPLSKRPVTPTGKTDRRVTQNLIASVTEADLQAYSDLDL